MANHTAQQEKCWTIVISLLFCVFLLIATSDAHDEMEEYLEFFPTHPVSSPLYKCPPGYTLMDGVNCYKAIATPLTVEDARLECWADGGGSLAFPKHLGENLAIGQLARGAGISRNYWLGYERYGNGIKDLVGEDGKMPVGVGEWAINQPSEFGGKCVSADASLDWFSWSYTECDQTLPFICHRCGCVGDEFFCLNGGCVKTSYVCDGEDQCGDNSDEMDSSCLVECGGWLSIAGTTTYPATGPYPGSADCWWIIPASPTTDIELLLNYLNTEELCDFLDIYVGGPVQSKARLAKSLSGQHSDLRFTGHGLMLHFTSNAANGGISGQSEGFKFQWTPVNRRNERLVASLSAKTLAGPAEGYCNTVFKYYITPDQPHNLITVNVLSDPSGGLMVFRDNYERLLPGYTTSPGEQLTLMFNTGDGASFRLEYFRGCDFDIISPTTKINIPPVKSNCLAECSWKIVDPNNRRLTWKSTFGVEAEVYENQQTWAAGDGGTTFTQTSSDTGLFVRYKPVVGSGLQADVSIGCEPYDTTNFDNTTLNTDLCDTNSLRCQAGYIFDIPGKDICMPNLNEWPPGYSKCEFGGIWTPAVIPTCTRFRCGPTPSLVNGFVSSVDSFYYGGIANYTCFDCYERTGDPYICNELGNWEPPSSGSPPRCAMKECSPPNNITNGVVIVTDTNHQCCSVLNYECDEGYALTAGPSAAVCMGDGQYMPSPQPTCKKICCPVPYIANAVSSVAESHVDYNDTVDVTCNAGYMLNDGSTNYSATCQSNGELLQTEPCIDIDECSSSPFPCMPDNTVTNCHNYPGGFSCSCTEGYELDADDITCNDITVCDVLPFSCARGNCTDLTGSIYSCSCADPYELFTYNNQQGFQVKPGESGYRKGDVYQIQHTCIPKRCPGTELPVTDESVERIQWSGQSHYEVGAVVELSCNHGYCIGGGDSIFNASYECNATGTWIPPNETCEVCQCTVPPTASSDSATPDVAIGTMHNYGQTVTYTCSSPYHAVTYKAVCGYNCDANKYELIGGPRECERIDCELPEAPYLISTAGNTLSDHADAMFEFQCDINYVVIEPTNLTVTCTNGLWDFHGLYCGAQTCQDPGTPDGGSQASDTGGIPSYNVGDTVVLNCALDYQTPVPAEITCLDDLTWSTATNLSCVDAEAPTCDTETIIVGQGDRLDTIKHRPTTVVENSGYYTVAPVDMQIGALFTKNISVAWNVTDGSGNSVLCKVLYIYPVSGCPALVSIDTCESASVNLTNADLKSFSPPLQPTTAASANSASPKGYAPQLYTNERITQDATGFNGDTDQCIYELQYLPNGCDIDVFKNRLYPGVGSCADATTCKITAPNNKGYGNCSSEVMFSCVDGAFESEFGSTHNSYPVPARTSFSYKGIIANFTSGATLPTDLTVVKTELDNLAGVFATRCMADLGGVYTIEAGAFAINDLTITKSYSVSGPSATLTASCLGSIGAIITACTTSPHIAALRAQLTALSECTSTEEEGCPATINELPTSGSFIVSECCCELCPPGTFYEVGGCTECAVGTYSDTEHSANCTECPGTMTTLFSGATSVDYCYESECDSPLVQGSTLAEPCETIAADMYWVNSTSSDACDPNTGTSGSSRGTTSMCQAMCAPGNYSCSGFEPCAACPHGFYSNETGSTSCTQCDGTMPYTTNTGSLNESDCVAYPGVCAPLDCTGTGAIITKCTFDITACDCMDGYIGLECEELWIDPCISQPCYNGGACTRGSGDYTCSCPAGTTGTNCVDILTDCDPSPCTNGVCEELVNDYRCHCPEGIFEGDTCATGVDICATTNPCLNGGACVNQAPGSYQCKCASGYIGVNCTEDIDVCAAGYGSVFCANGGTCVDGAGLDYSCACVDGFTGFQCVIPPDDMCASIDCSDAGMCYPDHKTSAPTCACLDLYSVDGTTCVPDNNCDTNPCVNGGSCETQSGSYTCNCLAGNEGFHCQQYTDECVSDPCQNGGSCTDLNNPTGYMCSCLYGFTGTDCETNIDDCIMCVNHIDCEDLVGDHVCNCKPGYTGKNCETEIDFCASCPCQHGGTCNPTVNQYTCTCAAGWVGDDCEDLEDLCASTPCQNDGTCTNVLGGYFCKCKDGILGTHCETQPSTCIIADPCVRGVCMATQLWQQATCICPDLYEGDSCECIENLCQTDPCLNGGTCDQDELGAYSCQCRTGYAGFNCETDINDCMGVSCGDGVCQDKVGYYVCVCPDGFGGPSCDKPTNRQFDIHLSGATAASRVPIDISGCEELTVGVWVKYTEGVGSSPGTFLTVDYDGGTLFKLDEFGLKGGATVNYHSDVDISDHNEWSYVTACISASEIRVSLGTAFRPGTIDGVPPPFGNSLIIKAGSANFFGTVSLIQAWCRCLPELEIQAITNAGNVDTNVADNGLVFDYRQDALNLETAPSTTPSYRGVSRCPFGTLSVNDQCQDLPTIENCPSDIAVKVDSNTQMATASFTKPTSTYPLQTNVMPGDRLGPGTTVVVYNAYDNFGHRSDCKFNIFARLGGCEKPAEPITGSSVCTSGDVYSSCMPKCGSGYDFVWPSPNISTCGALGRYDHFDVDNTFTYPPCGKAECSKTILRMSWEYHLASMQASVQIALVQNYLGPILLVLFPTSMLEVAITAERNTGVSIEAPGVTCDRDDWVPDCPDIENTEEYINYLLFTTKRFNLDDVLGGDQIQNVEVNCEVECTAPYAPNGDCCVECPKGTYYDTPTTSCMYCARGTYQDVAGQYSCKPCLTGSTTKSVGADDVGLCMPNCTAGNRLEGSMCVPCGYGKYQEYIGQDHCHMCPPNYTTATTTATSPFGCIAICDYGYQMVPPSIICTPCPVGEYRGPGMNNCTRCPLDTSTVGVASIDESHCNVTKCSPGRQMGSAGTCEYCPLDYYREEDMDQCEPCVNMTRTMNVGADRASNCSETCEAGYYLLPNDKCQECPIGTFKESNQSFARECESCSGSKTTRELASTSPDQCFDVHTRVVVKLCIESGIAKWKPNYGDKIQRMEVFPTLIMKAIQTWINSNAAVADIFIGGLLATSIVPDTYVTFEAIFNHTIEDPETVLNRELQMLAAGGRFLGESDIILCRNQTEFILSLGANCSSGRMYSEQTGMCIPCQKDYYQPEDFLYQCLPCPDGYITEGIGRYGPVETVCHDMCHDFCHNGGTCTIEEQIPRCRCPREFDGTRCEIYLAQEREDLIALWVAMPIGVLFILLWCCLGWCKASRRPRVPAVKHVEPPAEPKVLHHHHHDIIQDVPIPVPVPIAPMPQTMGNPAVFFHVDEAPASAAYLTLGDQNEFFSEF